MNKVLTKTKWIALILFVQFGLVVAAFCYFQLQLMQHNESVKWVKDNNGKVLESTPLMYYETPTSIEIKGRIDTLEPLKCFSKLETLTVIRSSGTPSIRDLKPLSGLTELRHVSLITNSKVDFTPLTHLENLDSLKIHVSLGSSPPVLEEDMEKDAELDKRNRKAMDQIRKQCPNCSFTFT